MKSEIFSLVALGLTFFMLASVASASSHGDTRLSCTSTSIIGDINGDGVIKNNDADLIKDVILDREKEPTNTCCIDVNGDGAINIQDSLAIERYIAGERNITSVGNTCAACSSMDVIVFSEEQETVLSGGDNLTINLTDSIPGLPLYNTTRDEIRNRSYTIMIEGNMYTMTTGDAVTASDRTVTLSGIEWRNPGTEAAIQDGAAHFTVTDCTKEISSDGSENIEQDEGNDEASSCNNNIRIEINETETTVVDGRETDIKLIDFSRTDQSGYRTILRVDGSRVSLMTGTSASISGIRVTPRYPIVEGETVEGSSDAVPRGIVISVCPDGDGSSATDGMDETCATYTRNGETIEYCATCGNGVCETNERCTPSTVGENLATSDCGPLYCPEDCKSPTDGSEEQGNDNESSNKQVMAPTNLSISGLNRQEVSSGLYRVEGYFIRDLCPPCPEGAQCEPCLPGILISEESDPIDYNKRLNETELQVPIDNQQFSVDEFNEETRYAFTINVTDPGSETSSRNFVLADYEVIDEPEPEDTKDTGASTGVLGSIVNAIFSLFR